MHPYIQKLLNGEKVEWRTLGEVAKLSRGRVISKEFLRDNQGEYPVYSSQTLNNGELGKISSFDFDGDFLTWTTDGAHAGTIFKRNGKFSITNVCGLIDNDKEIIDLNFLYHWLSSVAKKYVYSGMGNPKLMSNQMEKIQIPLPPLSVQQKIAEILDCFSELEAELEAELELRQKQYAYYRNHLLSPDENHLLNGQKVEWKTLGEVGEVRMCKRILKNQTSSIAEIPFYKIGTFGKKADAFISRELFEEYKKKYNYPKKGEILISASGTIGRTVIFDGEDSYFQDSNIVWIENNENLVLNKYLFYFYQITNWDVAEGGTIQRLYNDNLKKIKIPIPPLEEQERIVKILDTFDILVNSISQGLPKEITLRRKQYEYYREQLLMFND